MTPDERRGIVMSAEGGMLTNVQRVGVDYTADYTRATIDGHVNALIRMEGAEAIARFAFALGDRVVAGLRAPTDFRALEVKLPELVPGPPLVEPPRDVIEPAAERRIPAPYLWGVLHGALLALWMLYVSGRLS